MVYSVDPNAAFSTDITVANSPNVKPMNQALVVTPQDYAYGQLTQQQEDFRKRAMESDNENRLAPTFSTIAEYNRKLDEFKSTTSAYENSQRYKDLLAEKRQLEESVRPPDGGNVYGAIPSMDIGYDLYKTELTSAQKDFSKYSSQLREAQSSNDRSTIEELVPKIEQTEDKLVTLTSLKPGTPEFFQKYPESVRVTRYVESPSNYGEVIGRINAQNAIGTEQVLGKLIGEKQAAGESVSASMAEDYVSSRNAAAKALEVTVGEITTADILAGNKGKGSTAVLPSDYLSSISGYTSKLGDSQTQKLIASGMDPRTALETQRQEAIASGNRGQARFYANELDKGLQNVVRLSSDYHYTAKVTDLRQPPNPFENAGDVSLAILKGGNLKDNLTRNYEFNPSVTSSKGVLALLPNAKGTQENAWDQALGKPVGNLNYLPALDILKGAEKSYGPYGSLGSYDQSGKFIPVPASNIAKLPAFYQSEIERMAGISKTSVINPEIPTAYDVQLNTVNPFSELQFTTENSNKFIGMTSVLTGEALTPEQRKAFTQEAAILPFQDQLIANKFLNYYDKQAELYSKIETDFTNYDYSDTSRSTLLNDIKNLSVYNPESAPEYIQLLKDVDIGKQVQTSSDELTKLSTSNALYQPEFPFKISVTGTGNDLNFKTLTDKTAVENQTLLQKKLDETNELINKVQSPSMKQEYQDIVNESVKFGNLKKDLMNATQLEQSNFNLNINTLKYLPSETKTELKNTYTNLIDAKNAYKQADTLVENASRTGISNKDIDEIKKAVNSNPVLTSVDPETGKKYSEEIIDNLTKVKSGYWSEEDYKNALPFDIITGTALSMRSEAIQSRNNEGANFYNTGKFVLGSIFSLPGTTVYGTARMLGIGGGATETEYQNPETPAYMPSFGGVGVQFNKAILNTPVIGPILDFAAPIAGQAGKISGRNLETPHLIPFEITERAFTGNADLTDTLAQFIQPTTPREKVVEGREYAGGLVKQLFRSPFEEPGTFIQNLAVGWGIGKVFEGISIVKNAKVITPLKGPVQTEQQLIETKLATLKPSEFSTKVAPVEGAFPEISSANPLARITAADMQAAHASEQAARQATREALFSRNVVLNQQLKRIDFLSGGIDLTIASPFLIGGAVDLYSKKDNPEAIGRSLAIEYVPMIIGGSGAIGRTFTERSTLGEPGAGASGYETTSLGLRTRSGEVESFTPAISLTKTPIGGTRLPLLSKEFGYKLELGTPRVYSEELTVQPARKTMPVEKQLAYDKAVKEYGADIRAATEMPGLLPVDRVVSTDARIQYAIREIQKVDKSLYSKLPEGELVAVMELSAKYMDAANVPNRVTSSGKIIPENIDPKILSAELVRRETYSDVNKLSPLGRNLVYETIYEANMRSGKTPLSRALINAEEKAHGRSPKYTPDEINKLPTVTEKLFGNVEMESMNPMEANILKRFLQDAEKKEIKKTPKELINEQIAEIQKNMDLTTNLENAYIFSAKTGSLLDKKVGGEFETDISDILKSSSKKYPNEDFIAAHTHPEKGVSAPSQPDMIYGVITRPGENFKVANNVVISPKKVFSWDSYYENPLMSEKISEELFKTSPRKSSIIPSNTNVAFNERFMRVGSEFGLNPRISESSAFDIKKAIPESEKIRLERAIKTDTSGIGRGDKKYVKPAIKALIDEYKLPNSEAVADSIIKTSIKYDADLFGSIVQYMELLRLQEEGLKIQSPANRIPRDLDIHQKNPNIAAYEYVDSINKAAGEKVVFLDSKGTVKVVKKYSSEESALFDLHDKDIGEFGAGLGKEEYLGFGFRSPDRMLIAKGPEGKFEVITISEQASRKMKGASIFTESPRKLTTEGGVTVEGRVVPHHEGRIKDIEDFYIINKYQADVIEMRGNPARAAKVNEMNEQLLDSFGPEVAKSAREKAAKANLDFLENVGYSMKKGEIKLPKLPTVAPVPTREQMEYEKRISLQNLGKERKTELNKNKEIVNEIKAQVALQKIQQSMRSSVSQSEILKKLPTRASKTPLDVIRSKKYNYGIVKSPRSVVSSSGSNLSRSISILYGSKVSSTSKYTSNLSKYNLPSSGRYGVSGPSPSPRPSPSPSPSSSISSRISSSIRSSISPSPSPSRSPSPYKYNYSPSPYRSPSPSPSPSYVIPKIKIPLKLLGLPGGGGGGDERRIGERLGLRKIQAPIATGSQLLTGKGLFTIKYNLGGFQSPRVNKIKTKIKRRK